MKMHNKKLQGGGGFFPFAALWCETLTTDLKDTYKSHLDKIRGVFEETRDKIYDLITDLDEQADEERISQLKQIDKQLADKFKKNDKEVREEMIKLLAVNEENTNNYVKVRLTSNLRLSK